MATYYADASRPDDSGNGLTWATAKKTIQAAVDLLSVIGANTVYLAGGTYNVTTARIAMDVAGSSAAAMSYLKGSSGGVADGNGQYGTPGQTVILRDSTTVDAVSIERSYVGVSGIKFTSTVTSTQSEIYTGNVGTIIEDCEFANSFRAINFGGTSGIIRRNKFKGSRVGSTANLIDFQSGSSGKMYQNEFERSDNLLKQISGNLTNAASWDIFLNVFSGFALRFFNCGAGNGTYNLHNNIICGNNGDKSQAAQSILFLNAASATINFDYNIVHPSVLYPSTSYIRSGSTGTYNLGSYNIHKSPLVDKFALEGFLGVVVDDNPQYAKRIADEIFNPVGQKITVACAAYKNGYGQLLTSFSGDDLVTFINAGNDVACHSYSHPNLSNLSALKVTGPAGSSVVIVADHSVGNSAAWTGTISFLESSATIATFNLQDYLELGDLATAANSTMYAHNTAWSIAYDYGNSMSAKAKSVCLATQTVANPSGSSINMDSTAFYYVELKEAKDIIEDYIAQHAVVWTRSEGYEVKFMCMPFNAVSDTIRTAAESYGYTALRGSVRRQPSDLYQFEPFKMGYIYSDDLLFDVTDEVSFRRNAATCASGYEALGYISTIELHDPLQTSSLSDEQLVWLAGELESYQYCNLKEGINAVLDRITTSARWTAGGAGKDVTYTASRINDSDYHIKPTSPGLGAGTKITGITTDIEGNPLFPPYNIGPFGLAAGALGVAPVANDGAPRNNITRLTGTSATISPTDTYELEDTNAWRVVAGWAAGMANFAFDADGVPIPFTGQQLIDAGIGPRLYCGSKGVAGYVVDQDAPTNAKIIKILKVPTYIDTLYWADYQEFNWEPTSGE